MLQELRKGPDYALDDVGNPMQFPWAAHVTGVCGLRSLKPHKKFARHKRL